MGMSSEPSGGTDPVAEINVTPMVDVLLSLLIIFMVAQPKPPNENIPLDVPKESPTQLPSDPNATLLVTVNADGTNKIGKTPLSKNYDKMVEQFQLNEKAQKDGKIAIKAEGDVKYGQIVRVMAAAHEAGIADVGLASEKF